MKGQNDDLYHTMVISKAFIVQRLSDLPCFNTNFQATSTCIVI